MSSSADHRSPPHLPRVISPSPASATRVDLWPAARGSVPLEALVNRTRIPDVAQSAAEEFAWTNLHGDALLASRTLSSAFYYKCGYQPTEFVAQEKQDPARSKGAAVFSMAGQLEKEARLSRQDLRHFLRMKVVKETLTESVLGAQVQNHAAHAMAVFLVAYYLTKNFRAFPDPLAEQIIHKIFRWTVGKSIQEALDSKDCRELTSTGVKEEAGSIFQILPDEEIGSFFGEESQA